ncbi:phosphatase PAP2 family protein [Mycolicibacterium madagascariense]|uniref:Phosphatase PAP2 family protein n=1 Tax=Mycolicibacterium madagascariense TaxID=212765 RepID=A0A7I7XBQ6_9MYCO|nr:phosphatase PAP2 family protein [Mycolicibacterium madagascariense]BBZ26363.1 phosphatase PAP2 family protein [Mycolicibacterium madagascariense]
MIRGDVRVARGGLWSAVLAGAVYAVMWVGWSQGWHWVVATDAATLRPAYRIGVAHHGWVTFWNVWCSVFSPLSFRALTLGLVVLALVRRRIRLALFLFATVELSAVVAETAKRLADRPRPATELVHAASTSFPSGHAVGTMIVTLVAWLVLLPVLGRAGRRWTIGLGCLLVLSVGAGRVALNVHHLSDVVAGWALGYLWVVLCLAVLGRPRLTAPDETPAGPGSAR